LNGIVADVKRICGEVREDEPLAQYTTIRTGGRARCLVRPEHLETAGKVVLYARRAGVPLFVLGRGSNILVSDEGFPGIVLATERMNRVRLDGNLFVCECGARLSTLIRLSMQRGLSGIEFLAGIPGTVGGAVAMNAGLKTRWISSVVERVEVLEPDGVFSPIEPEEARFAYRFSRLAEGFAGAVYLRVTSGNPAEVRKEVIARAREKAYTQPLAAHSAGSVFKNPEGMSAGRMIEEAGLKGLRVGGAEVSRLHANFIVTLPGATSLDVFRLMRRIQQEVFRRTGIMLELEVKLVGRFPDNENNGTFRRREP